MARRVHQPLENQEFDFILTMADGPVLAYFVGTWPKAVEACKAMDPVVSEAAERYAGRLTAVRVDMTRCPEPVRRYGVTGAPSVVLIKAGEAAAREAGPLDGPALRAFLDGNL
ncbi:thioredoxin domain-containing protein [Streptomyces sp. ASQP_92]|uniref:thioredoxin family protein n=1 Tax=Streptomyces sp. ASQP_92 TaxID=2979116 RepID=UPI0021BE8BC2|nr:thioredoxin domain-containing protein [Streptomyces sp. ASQP_92]MCT9088793.1 thioredoxin domain-containing protein [Streptomyces sp. ASQP_92]